MNMSPALAVAGIPIPNRATWLGRLPDCIVVSLQRMAWWR